MGFWIGAAILLAIIAVFVRRGLQMKSLAHHGVLGQAEVVQKMRSRSSAGHQTAGFITYRFGAPNGQQLSKRIAVSEQIYSEYNEGDSIEIVYLEDRPATNATRYMANLSRKALKLPPI